MKIGIVGLGLIGGTIAKSLNKTHFVSAYDISNETLEYAIENKIVHKTYTDIESFLSDNNVFFLCLYPNQIINFIFQNKDLISNSSVIIEISGVKKQLISEINKLGNLNFDLIYTHPIAGSEKVGIMHSNQNIFRDANYVITPVDSNKKANLDLVKNLAIEMGFKNISMISPEEHDDIIAYTSQLTHILSISLVNAIFTELDTSKFIGDSYRDLTRISMINESLWPELFLYNKQALLNKIDNFENELSKIKNAIKENNPDKLADLMIKSTSIRSSIERSNKDEN